MSKFSEELNKLTFSVDTLSLQENLEKMTMEDQEALAQFATALATAGSLDKTADEISNSASFFVWGFTLGHNWVRDHWTLW